LIFLTANAQEAVKKVRLGYLTANFTNPSYVYGPLKSMTQTSYEAKLVNGEVQKGDKLKNSVVGSNVSFRHITFNFNKNGEMVSSTMYDDQGNPDWTSVFDNKNGKIQKVLFLHKDTLKRYNQFIYGQNGLTEIQYYNAEDDKMTGKTIYECDKNGNQVRSVYLDSEGTKIYEIEIERESQGRIHWSVNKNKDGVVVSKVEYLYDKIFEPASMDIKVEEGKEVDKKGKREYTFDSRGNWIKQIRYENDKPLNITERSYTFY
jgi:hypothetical protein